VVGYTSEAKQLSGVNIFFAVLIAAELIAVIGLSSWE